MKEYTYKRIKAVDHPRAYCTGYYREHIIIAEKALGHYLPAGAVVHHADCNRHNNVNSNLVICQDDAYHALLHARMKALQECGDPRKRKCYCCQEYDYPENMISHGNGHFHASCKKQYDTERYLSNAAAKKRKNHRNYLRRTKGIVKKRRHGVLVKNRYAEAISL